MDKIIRRVKLSTVKDEHGSSFSIIFENQTACIRFHDGRNGTQRYIHQSYPAGIEALAMLFEEINDFEQKDAYFFEEQFNKNGGVANESCSN